METIKFIIEQLSKREEELKIKIHSGARSGIGYILTSPDYQFLEDIRGQIEFWKSKLA